MPNVRLLAPLDYMSFVACMQRAHILLTDSGGIQEEGPSLGKPVLVMRETSERPEAIAVGTARLTGTNPEAIVAAVSSLLDDPACYARMTSRPIHMAMVMLLSESPSSLSAGSRACRPRQDSLTEQRVPTSQRNNLSDG